MSDNCREGIRSSVPRRKCSHPIFGGFLPRANDPESPASPLQRNRSAGFVGSSATTPPPTPTGNRYSQASRPTGSSRRPGSVLNLVMRQKSVTVEKKNVQKSTPALRRLPSTPSLPLAIVQSMFEPMRKISLDESSSVFYSDYTSSAASSPSSNEPSSGYNSSSKSNHLPVVPPPSPWKFMSEEEETQIERELDRRCATSMAHLIAKNPNIALRGLANNRHQQNVGEKANSNVLCAEGHVQTFLLSSVAPVGKRVVNIGRSVRDDDDSTIVDFNSSSCSKFNLNNMKLTEK